VISDGDIVAGNEGDAQPIGKLKVTVACQLNVNNHY
jgi:hypothetical protein